jgi:formylglycine-generating enzyme required for sulfatase activity
LGNSGTLARTGYSWTGWNTVADGSGTHYDEDGTFEITSNTTLYAEWDETPVGTIGDYSDVAVGSETIRMIIASNISSMTFPTGTDDSGTGSLTHRLYMQETVLTNAQAVAILQWAYNNSKFSATVSDHNGLSSATVKWGGQELFNLDSTGNGTETYNIQIAYSAGTFSVRNSMGDYPVVHNSWYGAVMICNWLTEMKDGNTDNLVYAGIDTTWVANETTIDYDKTGYRLPTRAEWWYSARYRGADTTNTVVGYTNPYFTQGDSASGATADYTNATETAAVAVYNVSALAAVKTKTANTLGLYDISGNIWEWLENYSTASAYDIGGAWDNEDAAWCRIGTESSNTADDLAYHVGFRIAKTYTEVIPAGATEGSGLPCTPTWSYGQTKLINISGSAVVNNDPDWSYGQSIVQMEYVASGGTVNYIPAIIQHLRQQGMM